MRIPNGDQAVVDIRKLRDYCLNPDHPEGRHKAGVFLATLGLTREDAEELQVALLAAARNDEATLKGETLYGTSYEIEFYLTRGNKSARIRSGWIIRTHEEFPRLTSAYVKTESREQYE